METSQNAPYGARGEGDILGLIQQAADMLLQRQIKLLVLGSSTITTVGLVDLRSQLTLPIIGTDPAVGLAVDATRSKVVGVLSTRATAHGKLLDDLVARLATPKEVHVLRAWHDDLVPTLERGETDTPALRAILRDALGPLAAAGADQLVLASTYFTFLKHTIQAEFGNTFGFTDSAETVTAEVAAALRREDLNAAAGEGGSTTYLFTGDLELARAAVVALLSSVSSGEATAAERLAVYSLSTSTL